MRSQWNTRRSNVRRHSHQSAESLERLATDSSEFAFAIGIRRQRSEGERSRALGSRRDEPMFVGERRTFEPVRTIAASSIRTERLFADRPTDANTNFFANCPPAVRQRTKRPSFGNFKLNRSINGEEQQDVRD